MSGPHRNDAPDPASRNLSNRYGVSASFTTRAGLRSLMVEDFSVLLYPASEVENGLAGLWLRRIDNSGTQFVSLTGHFATGSVTWPACGPTITGHWGELAYIVVFQLADDHAAWFWHVQVVNEAPAGSGPAVIDLVMAQDVALAPIGSVRTNEYYVSQYLDLTPIAVPGHGTALAIRQNMPGPTPWCLVGALGTADRWCTDALQLTGRGRAEGAPWPGLSADLPSARLQHEHTLAALQTDRVSLAAQESWQTGFFGLVVADHQPASGPADVAFADALLADPALARVGGLLRIGAAEPRAEQCRSTPSASLFGNGTALSCRALTSAELDGLTGPRRDHAEHADAELLSYFGENAVHTVTGAKQRAVLRPHGHLLRSGSTLLPDEHSIAVTTWMDGTFCSQLTQGHVGFGAILSLRRGYLGVNRAHGLRIFVSFVDEPDWRLLGTPSAWSERLDGCDWWYAHDRGLMKVTCTVPADADACVIEVSALQGPSCALLVAMNVTWSDPDAGTGALVVGDDHATLAPPLDTLTSELYPGGHLRLDWDSDVSVSVADDAPLFTDYRSRGLPWLTLSVEPVNAFRMTLTPRLVPPRSVDPLAPQPIPAFWRNVGGAVELVAPATMAGDQLRRIGSVLPWFTHDALVHYLSPRGLEQFSGGSWGTRDVSQGPVGLLIGLGAFDELRSLVLLIMRAQNVRGDWPQAFDFLERHRRAEPGEAHGDVVYWPLLALAEYLHATGDSSLLAEQVAGHDDHDRSEHRSVADHLRAALSQIDRTMIGSTGMPAYGHGDWNDSLQPADPAMAARMCSSWTVALQTHVMRQLATAIADSAPDITGRAEQIATTGLVSLQRTLMVDGVLAGYGLFGSDGAVRPLIHPLDTRTGLRFSILPMIQAISAGLLTREQADDHLRLIAEHLTGPDGVRLFDRPVGYHGGPMELFQRAEASTFFGREIGIMYMHAHLRYAEALARFGDASGLLTALVQAQPVGITDQVPMAAPRQSTCYFSSSDAAFPDRYAAAEDYHRVTAGEITLEGGWRVYSSGPGLFLQIVVQSLLGVRVRGESVEFDPVLPAGLDGLSVRLPLLGRRPTIHFDLGGRQFGPAAIRVGSVELDAERLTNPYRLGGLRVRSAQLLAALGSPHPVIEIRVG